MLVFSIDNNLRPTLSQNGTGDVSTVDGMVPGRSSRNTSFPGSARIFSQSGTFSPLHQTRRESHTPLRQTQSGPEAPLQEQSEPYAPLHLAAYPAADNSRGSYYMGVSGGCSSANWNCNPVLALANWTTPSVVVTTTCNSSGAGPSSPAPSFLPLSEQNVFQPKRTAGEDLQNPAKRTRYFDPDESEDSGEDDPLAEQFDPETFYRKQRIDAPSHVEEYVDKHFHSCLRRDARKALARAHPLPDIPALQCLKMDDVIRDFASWHSISNQNGDLSQEDPVVLYFISSTHAEFMDPNGGSENHCRPGRLGPCGSCPGHDSEVLGANRQCLQLYFRSPAGPRSVQSRPETEGPSKDTEECVPRAQTGRRILVRTISP